LDGAAGSNGDVQRDDVIGSLSHRSSLESAAEVRLHLAETVGQPVPAASDGGGRDTACPCEVR